MAGRQDPLTLEGLPEDVLEHLLSFVGLLDTEHLALTCRQLHGSSKGGRDQKQRQWWWQQRLMTCERWARMHVRIQACVMACGRWVPAKPVARAYTWWAADKEVYAGTIKYVNARQLRANVCYDSPVGYSQVRGAARCHWEYVTHNP